MTKKRLKHPKLRASKNKRNEKSISQPITNPNKMDKLLVWEIVRNAAPIAGIIFMIIAGIKIHKIEEENKRLESGKSANYGSISPQRSIIPDVLTCYIGTNEFKINTDRIRNGREFKPFSIISINLPFSISLSQEGRLSINGSFTDFDGKIIAVMKNNEWETNPNNYFRRNYDTKGFEVIDIEGLTKLQVEYIDYDKIKFGGVFKDSLKWVFVSDTTIEYASANLSKEEIIKKSAQVSDMFLYPADKYFGVRQK